MRSLSTIQTSPAPLPLPRARTAGPRRAAVIVLGAIVVVIAIVGGGWLFATTQVDRPARRGPS